MLTRSAGGAVPPLDGPASWWDSALPADEALDEPDELPDPDPASVPPEWWDAWAVDVPAEVLEEYLSTTSVPEVPEVREALRAGILPRVGGYGAGFATGGAADNLAPGVTLAGFASDAWADGLERITDDELIGVLRAWRRLLSWSAAGELAAVAELDRRRTAEVAAGADSRLAEHVGDEIAVPLTLTVRAADQLLEFAVGLGRLPLIRAALAAGVIDRDKARVITDEVGCLTDAHAAAVEAAVIGRAGAQTTGQLRAATRRAVLAADPAAADRKREEARKDARIEVWNERSGTAALAGRDLPPADVLAADQRIDSLARHLQACGAEGTLNQVRARVYTALLLGNSPESLLASTTERGAGSTPERGAGSTPAGTCGGENGPAASRPAATTAGLTGSVNLTMPLATWLGVSGAPGEVPGFGPLPAEDSRALADLLAADPASRWCLTVTDRNGRAVAHGCATTGPASASPRRDRPRRGPSGQDGSGAGWTFTVRFRPLATADCTHERETTGYRPSRSLRHVIVTRQRTCCFPGCRRPATCCDLDHTIPFHQGGKTCECNLAPLCRRHHRAKQVQGWHLEQPQPGVLVWTLPSGRSYRVGPVRYPGDGTVP